MPETAWLSYADPDSIETAIRWLRDDPNWADRAFLIPRRKWDDPLLDAYASNGNVGIDRGATASAGGPVLCLGPTLKLLEQATQVTDNDCRLAVIEWATPKVRGWAAATGAINLTTGEVESAPEGDALAALDALGGISFLRHEDYYKRIQKRETDVLNAAGYDLYYVQTYLIARGHSAADVEDAKRYLRPSTEG